MNKNDEKHPEDAILASEVIEHLKKLIKTHGDLPIMIALPDDGTYNLAVPKYDADGLEDECFIVYEVI